MVDALRRASRWIDRHGCVIDIHPTPVPAQIDADGRPIGAIESADAAVRHAAADAAVRHVTDTGLLVATGTSTFDFYTHADSLAELREYIEENWRDSRVAVYSDPGAARVRARERVRLTKLIPGPIRELAPLGTDCPR